MSLQEVYKEKILEEELREFLEDGTIPTADQLLEAYEERVADHADLTRPFVLDGEYTVEENEESSVMKYNGFLDRVQDDLQALYTTTFDLTQEGTASFERWRIELDSLNKKVQNLQRRIESLLLVREDTAGFFNYVEDSFADVSNVDQANTTASVDPANHLVTLSNGTDSDTGVSAETTLSPVDLQNSEARFTVLEGAQTLSATDARGTSTEQAISDVGTFWQHRVRTKSMDRPVHTELNIKLDNSAVNISRVVIELHSANSSSSIIISGMYSNDNYNWYNLPCDNYTQSVDNRAVFIFPSTSMQWLKFHMTKVGPDDVDNGQYVYEFGAQSIKFYDTSYDVDTGSYFYSNDLSAYDDDGDRIKFNKASLQCCQEVPEDTEIKYWLIAKNATAETEPARISPFNIDNPVAPLVVDFGKLSKTSETGLYKVGKAETDSVNFFAAYKDLLESDKLALIGSSTSAALSLGSSTMDNIANDTIKVYRNIGPNGGTTDTVRDAPLGWRYDESETYLMTTIVVNNKDGLEVDFGNNAAILDGAAVKNRVVIPAGTHTFKTLVRNTAALSSLGPFSDESTLEAADSLYPYNHRTIIEGADYASDYTETKKYLGVDIYCEYIAMRVSVFDMLHNTTTTDYSRYAIDTDPDGDYVFVIKFDPNDSNHANEKFRIDYSSGSDMYDRVVLKAQLTSYDTSKTPQLQAFRVKLGM